MKNHKVKIQNQREDALVIPDLHVPYHHEPTVNIIFQVAEDLDPEHIVFIGDCFDAEHLGSWTKDTVEEGLYKTLDEIDEFREEILQPLRGICPDSEYYWCGGNHDMQRIKDAIEDLEKRKRVIDLEKEFPDIKLTEYNQYVKIGKMHYTHGTYHNKYHARKHVDQYQVNVMYGHTHTTQTFTKHTKTDRQPIKATSIGAACDLNPSYMKNKPNAWVHAFGVVHYRKDGTFTAHVPEIINNETIFNGKVYKA